MRHVTTFVFVFTFAWLLAVPAAARADEAEELRDRLEEVRQRIERYETTGEEPPDELVDREEMLAREIRNLSQRQQQEVTERAFAMLESISPMQADDFRRLRRENPEEFREHAREVMPWLKEMHRLREEEPEVFEFERQSHHLSYVCERLAEEVRQAGDDHRDERVDELRSRLRELFRVRVAMREYQIERLETELNELRGQVERMSNQSEEMIDRRLQALLGGGEEW